MRVKLHDKREKFQTCDGNVLVRCMRMYPSIVPSTDAVSIDDGWIESAKQRMFMPQHTFSARFLFAFLRLHVLYFSCDRDWQKRATSERTSSNRNIPIKYSVCSVMCGVLERHIQETCAGALVACIAHRLCRAHRCDDCHFRLTRFSQSNFNFNEISWHLISSSLNTE